MAANHDHFSGFASSAQMGVKVADGEVVGAGWSCRRFAHGDPLAGPALPRFGHWCQAGVWTRMLTAMDAQDARL